MDELTASAWSKKHKLKYVFQYTGSLVLLYIYKISCWKLIVLYDKSNHTANFWIYKHDHGKSPYLWKQLFSQSYRNCGTQSNSSQPALQISVLLLSLSLIQYTQYFTRQHANDYLKVEHQTEMTLFHQLRLVVSSSDALSPRCANLDFKNNQTQDIL